MIWTIIIIQTIAFSYLIFKISKRDKQKLLDEIKIDYTLFKNPVGVPDYNVVDPDYELLKNVIDSVKLECWKVIKLEKDHDCYDIELINSNKSLKIKCRIRDRYDVLYISWFHIFKMVDDLNHSHVRTFDDKDIKAKWMILNFIWDYVLNYHQEIYDKHIEYYFECKWVIQKELKTLNRDKQLVKLLEN